VKKACGQSEKGFFIKYGPIAIVDPDPMKCFQRFWDKVWQMAGENFVTVETLECPDFKEVVEAYKRYFLSPNFKKKTTNK
tara:strand:- start:1202 stop:1441 length:240 start_codon:yes stop_codon:yes gene_type:complete